VLKFSEVAGHHTVEDAGQEEEDAYRDLHPALLSASNHRESKEKSSNSLPQCEIEEEELVAEAPDAKLYK